MPSIFFRICGTTMLAVDKRHGFNAPPHILWEIACGMWSWGADIPSGDHAKCLLKTVGREHLCLWSALIYYANCRPQVRVLPTAGHVK
jgi:hypothetical protein